MTGQNVQDAIWQYKYDRDPNDLIFQFKKRTLVHFAVDPDLVFMTTKLAGKSTYFLPFNQGDGMGAGNPPAPEGKYKTSYLWEAGLAARQPARHSGAVHPPGSRSRPRSPARRCKKENDDLPALPPARRRAEAREGSDTAEGAGNNYLVMHSAGSGKSNTIAWLAHRLANLHDANDQKVFDSVIVVTDRRVLDQQLQNTIYQFEHQSRGGAEDRRGLHATGRSAEIRRADHHHDAAEVPVRHGEGRRTARRGSYAVIVDEAHSSQSGEAAAELKGVLAGNAISEQAKEEAEEKALHGLRGRSS